MLILLSSYLYADNLSNIINDLNPKSCYYIFEDNKQIVIEEVRLNGNNKIFNRTGYSEEYAGFNIDEIGDYIDTLLENKEYNIKRYETKKYYENELEINKKRKLVHITIQNKKNNEEKCIFYHMNVLPYNKDYEKYYNAFMYKDNILFIPIQDLGRLYIYIFKNTYLNNKHIIYKYYIPTILIDEIKIKAIDYISNNIIRIIKENKINNQILIEYWKISLTEEDINKNNEIILSRKIDKEEVNYMKLLWTNYNLSNQYLSYDSFKQDTEPTIEQLKEKFPDDTFFGDEVGDKEEIKTSSNNSISEGVNGISDATQSQNLNSHNNFFVQIFNKCKSFFANFIHPRVPDKS